LPQPIAQPALSIRKPIRLPSFSLSFFILSPDKSFQLIKIKDNNINRELFYRCDNALARLDYLF